MLLASNTLPNRDLKNFFRDIFKKIELLKTKKRSFV